MPLSGPAVKHQFDLSTSDLLRCPFPTTGAGSDKRWRAAPRPGGGDAEADQSGRSSKPAQTCQEAFSGFNEDGALGYVCEEDSF